MRILQVSAELFPLLKTGGLADIAGALPSALVAAGVEPRALLPGFPAIRAGLSDDTLVGHFDAPWGERLHLRRGTLAAVPTPAGPLQAYVLDAPGLFDRPGSTPAAARTAPGEMDDALRSALAKLQRMSGAA